MRLLQRFEIERTQNDQEQRVTANGTSLWGKGENLLRTTYTEY